MKKKIKIGTKIIREHGDVFVIAEAGVNHNGKLDLAMGLVDVAAAIGADAVKFQTFKADQVVTESGEMAAYQKRNTGKNESQREMLKKLELSEEFYRPIIRRCKQKKIIFFSTPHGGKKSVDFLESIGVELYKIDSGNLTNYILLDKIAKTKKPIVLSTGMSTQSEIRDAIKFIESRSNRKIILLHATTSYPCELEDVNLSAMVNMTKSFDYPVGYSDHTQDNQVAIMAVTLGAAAYEFHLTLDKTLPGPDQVASSDPKEAAEKIRQIRNVKKIMGNPAKKPLPIEKQYIGIVRRSLVYAQALNSGHILTGEDIDGKRPGNGISTVYYENFIGKKLKKDVKQDQQLGADDFI